MNNQKYRIGDFVTLNYMQDSMINKEDISTRVSKIISRKPDAFIVVNITDDGYLLALCWSYSVENLPFISVCGINIYYSFEKFYHFKECELLKSSLSTLSYMPSSDVAIIRCKRNKFSKQKVQNKKKPHKNKLQKQCEKDDKEHEEEILLRQKYKFLMETAVINNDRKEMQRIIKKLGYDPRYKKPGQRSSKNICTPSHSHGERIEIPNHVQWAIKHPYQGGGFSGK